MLCCDHINASSKSAWMVNVEMNSGKRSGRKGKWEPIVGCTRNWDFGLVILLTAVRI